MDRKVREEGAAAAVATPACAFLSPRLKLLLRSPPTSRAARHG